MNHTLDGTEDFAGFEYYDILKFNDAAYLRKRQRLRLMSVLNDLPLPLKQYLYTCPVFYLPRRFDSRLMDALTISPVGVGHLERPKKGYHYRRFADQQEMIAAAQSVGDKHDDKETYLWMGVGSPFLVVPLGWIRQNLGELKKAALGDLAVLTSDLKVGLILTQEDGLCHRTTRTGNGAGVACILGVWGY
jgi:hypothetical protein